MKVARKRLTVMLHTVSTSAGKRLTVMSFKVFKVWGATV
jgi:hypothetical protein